jgi:hypothetical protein
MQSHFTFKLITASLLIILILITGYILHRAGKPYPSWLFNVHKISTIAMIVLVSVTVTGFLKLENTLWLSYLCTGLLMLTAAGLLFSGGMMSLDKSQDIMLRIHQVATIILLGAYVLFIYLIITSTIK